MIYGERNEEIINRNNICIPLKSGYITSNNHLKGVLYSSLILVTLTLNIVVIRIDGIVVNSNRRTFEISCKRPFFN